MAKEKITKEDFKKSLGLGLVWAVYIFFTSIIGFMTSDSPNSNSANFFIAEALFIGIPVIASFLLRWNKNRKTKMFSSIIDFYKFVLPFFIGIILVILYYSLTFIA